VRPGLLRLWHGAPVRIAAFDASLTVDGGLHLGTRAQAAMRNAAFLHEVEVEVARIRRSHDRGGDWAGRIRAARAEGCDAIVYLNRYEGLDVSVIERLAASANLEGLDDVPDAVFRKIVPEARDSLILLRPERARILRVIARAVPEQDAGPDP
jgi:hypothetical protein